MSAPSSSRRAASLLPVLALFVLVAAVAYALRIATPWMEVNRGIFHHLQHNHEQAIRILGDADLKPPNFRPVHYLSLSHQRLGQTDRALEVLRDVCQEYPDWAEPHCELGTQMLRQGEWQEALPWLSHALERSARGGGEGLSADQRSLAEAALALRDGRSHQALERLNQISSDEVEEADVAALLRAMALIRLGSWGEARGPLERSLDAAPGNPRAAVMMSLALIADRDLHRARHWFDIARHLDSRLAVAHFFGELRRQIRVANDSPHPGVSASAVPRDDLLAVYTEYLTQAGQSETVVAHLEGQRYPELIFNHWVWHSWARALEAVGDEEGATTAAERMTELNPAWNLDPQRSLPRSESLIGWWAGGWQEIDLPFEGPLPEGIGVSVSYHTVLGMFANSALDLPVRVDEAGWHRVIFALHGRSSGSVWPEVEISVPPAPPVVKYIDNYDTHWHTAVLHFDAGLNTLRIAYVNDLEYLDPDEDRVVRLENVWIEREPLALEEAP